MTTTINRHPNVRCAVRFRRRRLSTVSKDETPRVAADPSRSEPHRPRGPRGCARDGRGCLSDGAGVALAEKVAPRHHLRMLLEQSLALALRHAAPDPELDLFVERLRPALVRHRAVTADNRSLTLGGGPPHKQYFRICFATQRLPNPSAIICGH